MAFNVSQFRSKLQKGGARANLFEVVLTAPAWVGLSTEQAAFMIKAASLPTSTVGKVEAPYFGRKIALGGDRTFEDWTITVINDETFDLRQAFERWQSGIASHTTNNNALRGLGADANPFSYVGKALVNQYSKDGSIVKTYELVNVWPVTVNAIDLSWETNDSYEEFTVQLAMDFFTTDGVI